MAPEVRSELGWYAALIYFGAWGSIFGATVASAVFPCPAENVLGLVHLNPGTFAAICFVVGHIVILAARKG